MTTYNTYQEAKIAMPLACIIEDTDSGLFFGMPTREGTTLAGGSRFAEPQYYCMTVEKFLADGYKFVEGDIVCGSGSAKEVTGSTVNIMNSPGCGDKLTYILRAAALEEKEPELTKDDSPQGILSAISNRLHNVGCEHQNLEFGHELSGMACDIWGVLPLISNESIQDKKPRTKVEYVEVTDSIFDLRPDFEAGELFSKVNHARDYSIINNTQTLAQALHQSCCYRRIEIKITEREAFIEEMSRYATPSVLGKMFDSGCRFVNHDSDFLRSRIRAVAEWEMNTSNNHDWESVAESIYCAVDDLLKS